MIGKQPESPLLPNAPNGGGEPPMLTSRNAPVPKVALASPGWTQPWPMRDACWSPTRAQIGGAPARALASARSPDEATRRGHARFGHPEPVQTGLVPDELRFPGEHLLGGEEAGHARRCSGRLCGLSRQLVTRSPTCRASRSAGRGCGWGRRCPGARPAWWRTRWAPSASLQPGARGRCRRSGGLAS